MVFWTAVLLVDVPPQLWLTVGGYVLAVLFYVANWAGVHGMLLGIFGHTWSLAIEEQFYVVWPLVVILLVRTRHPRRLAAVLAITAVASLGWRVSLAVTGAPVDRLYFGTDTHADGLLIGAALAVWLSGRLAGAGDAGGLRRTIGPAAVIALVVLLLTASMPGYAYGASALVALATAGLIFDAMTRRSRAVRILEVGWLAGVGRRFLAWKDRFARPLAVRHST